MNGGSTLRANDGSGECRLFLGDELLSGNGKRTFENRGEEGTARALRPRDRRVYVSALAL